MRREVIHHASLPGGTAFSGATMLAGVPVHDWERSQVTHPGVVAYPTCVDDIVGILTRPDCYPSPVRAIGSTHSTTSCGAADGGTLVDMTGMNRIIAIGSDTVTAEAGALYIDVAEALRQRNLQFFVNVEIGNLTLGSAACCGTKEASFKGELGQVCSYVIAMKLVTPSGGLIEVTHDYPRLLQVMRSSYGLLGIVYEVTFRVKPLQAMAVTHRTFRLSRLERKLPALTDRHQSVMLYIFPFIGRVSVELRDYVEGRGRPRRWVWWVRNQIWASVAPAFGNLVDRFIPGRVLRSFVVNNVGRLMGGLLNLVLRASNTIPTDQIIRYPARSDWRRYTFSLWAFPEATYPTVLRAYADFCKEHYRTHGYRSNLLTVGYRIGADRSPLLSYSFHGTVITIDPVSNGGPGWGGFLDGFNRFASAFGGIPLLNQTDRLTPSQARQALGPRLRTFSRARRRFDPRDRLLSPYFRTLLDASGAEPAPSPSRASDHRAEIVNFGRTVPFAATRLTPRSAKDVLEILRSHAGRKIRALGSGHSWSDVIRSEDIVLEMRAFSSVEVNDEPAPSVKVGAGCTIAELLKLLRRHGLTLPTVGAIAKQTVAGAVATGTHGSGASSLSHYVREMEIATYHPVSQEPFVLTLRVDSADPIEREELRAARCSLGYLGIVLSVTLECVKAYDVEETLELVPSLDKVLASAKDFPLQQFVLLPYAWKYYVFRRHERRGGRARGPWQWVKRMGYRAYKLVVIDFALHLGIKIFANLPWPEPSRWLFGSLIPKIALKGWTSTDDSTHMLTIRHDLYRHVEMETFVPAARLGEALDLVRELTKTFAAGGLKARPLPAHIEALLKRVPEAMSELSWSGEYTNRYFIVCRRIHPDDALISMTSGDAGDYYSVSVFSYRLGDPSFARYCRVLALCLTSLYGARLHWGKLFPLTHDAVERMYPVHLDRFREICGRYDPHGVFRNAYAQRVMGFPATTCRSPSGS
jgi:FAD/FMN-containing dehydrogenase